MNKIALSLLALAAFSTASFANVRDDGARQSWEIAASANDQAALVAESIGTLTAYERVLMTSQENDMGGHH